MYDRTSQSTKCTLIETGFKNLRTGTEAKIRPFVDALDHTQVLVSRYYLYLGIGLVSVSLILVSSNSGFYRTQYCKRPLSLTSGYLNDVTVKVSHAFCGLSLPSLTL